MKLYNVGDKSKAICPFCEQLRTTTFQERDVPLSSGKGTVHAVLAAICDICDRVVAIPQQSVPRIQAVVRSPRHPLEARIPRQLLDALLLACYDLGFGIESGPALFRFYLDRINRTSEFRKGLATLAASDDARGPATARFSAKLNDEMHSLLQQLKQASQLSRAQVIKGVIVQIKREVLDEKLPKVRQNLQDVLRVVG